MGISRGLVEMKHRIQDIQFHLNDLIIEVSKLDKDASALERYLNEYDVPKNKKTEEQPTQQKM